MTQPNVPIVNAGILYVNGLSIGLGADPTTLSIGAGAARDITNTIDLVVSNVILVSGNKLGVNGIDVAVMVPNTTYSVYVIGDSTEYQPVAGLLSLNESAPFLPAGYDSYRRIGFWSTNATAQPNTHFLKWNQFGSGEERMYLYDAAIPIATGANSTSYALLPNGTNNFSVPLLNTVVILQVKYTPGAAGQFISLAAGGSPNALAGNPSPIEFGYGSATGVLQSGVVEVPVVFVGQSYPQFLYRVQAGDSVTFSVIGFYDELS